MYTNCNIYQLQWPDGWSTALDLVSSTELKYGNILNKFVAQFIILSVVNSFKILTGLNKTLTAYNLQTNRVKISILNILFKSAQGGMNRIDLWNIPIFLSTLQLFSWKPYLTGNFYSHRERRLLNEMAWVQPSLLFRPLVAKSTWIQENCNPLDITL